MRSVIQLTAFMKGYIMEYFKLDGFVIFYASDLQFGIVETLDIEGIEDYYRKSFIKDDCLHIGSINTRKGSQFKNVDEFKKYRDALPIWNKTKYYSFQYGEKREVTL